MVKLHDPHTNCGHSEGHTIEAFTDHERVNQICIRKRYNPCTKVGFAFDQTVALKLADGFAQRSTIYSKSTCQTALTGVFNRFDFTLDDYIFSLSKTSVDRPGATRHSVLSTSVIPFLLAVYSSYPNLQTR